MVYLHKFFICEQLENEYITKHSGKSATRQNKLITINFVILSQIPTHICIITNLFEIVIKVIQVLSIYLTDIREVICFDIF